MTATLTAADGGFDEGLENLDLDGCHTYVHPDAVNHEADTEPLTCRQPGPAGS